MNGQMKKPKLQHKATQVPLQTYHHSCAANPYPSASLLFDKKTSQYSANDGNAAGKPHQDTPASKTLTMISHPKNSSASSMISTANKRHSSLNSVQVTSPSITTFSAYAAPKLLPALTARA
jgi:hypothetical protein